MLVVENLEVLTSSTKILNGISLSIEEGKTLVIMGPNGSGKTTLAMTIGGHPRYKVMRGKIILDGEDITSTPPEERARKGISILCQMPPALEGVKVVDLFGKLVERFKPPISIEEALEIVGLPKNFLYRDVNVGFSGGEKKRFEMAKVMLMNPKYAILDEPDSGVDVESLKFIARGISLLKERGVGMLIITHYRNVLKYIDVDEVCILFKGRIVKCGGSELISLIEEKGYRVLEVAA